MKKVICAAAFLAIAANVFAGDYTYDAGDFKDTAKMADKLTSSKIKKLKKWKTSKIVVAECAGEFLQGKEVVDSAFAQSVSDTVQTKTTTIQLGADYYNNLINHVYDMVQNAFTEAGYQFVPRENLTSQEKYKSLGLDFEKTTKGYTGGMFKDSVTTKGLKVSAEGLGLFPTNVFKAMKLGTRLAELTSESGADSAIQINFYIDKGKKFTPVLKSFEILYYGDIRVDTVGFKGHESKSYGFRVGNESIFKLEKPMKIEADVKGPEKGTVDMQKYDEALMKLINSAVDMLKVQLAAAKAE